MVASEEASVKMEGGQGSPSSPTGKDGKTKGGVSPSMGPVPSVGHVVPPYPPPPPPHHPGIHYYRPYPPPPGYEHSLPQQPPATGKGSKADASAREAPPLGPYTAAQYELRKQSGPPIAVPHYPGSAAAAATGAAPSATNSDNPSSSKSKSNNGSAPSGSSPNSPGRSGAKGRDPPPLPPHHYVHPGVSGGEHGPPPPHPPAHHHPGYPPYRGEEHHRGPHLPPPHHRHWGDYNPYYEGGSHLYPPPPPPHSSQYRTGGSDGRQPPIASNEAPGVKPNPSQLALGPYRFSDTTLRREALSHLRAKRAQQSGNGSGGENLSDADGRDGATSPSQIESSHRDEVTTMGCTCKKTKCLKLYCQCFAVKIYCGSNCRCMVCQNTSLYDRERQEAIRNILSRNPQAFDTKFKKAVPDTAAPELAHKLGCKCRKSACMKKYCECYAGMVKCSDSCRCVGCKNMGRPDGGPNFPPHHSHPVMLAPMPTAQKGPGLLVAAITAGEEPRKREPYMMDAAHNLAFLKHASPVTDKSIRAPRRTPSQDGESSMPSLSSEESPVESTKRLETRSPSASTDPTTAEKTAVNALLMAAVAMTEMSGQPTATTTTTAPSDSTPQVSNAATPPDSRHESMEGGDYKTPQKNLLRQFQSPKRKQGDTEESPVDHRDSSLNRVQMRRLGENSSTESSPSGGVAEDGDENDDSPKRELSEMSDLTPSVQQKNKKSRIGSVRKGGRVLEMAHSTMGSPMSLQTPKHVKGENSNKDLTPVSARCIDFKRMHVHETKQESSTDGSSAAGAVSSSKESKAFSVPKQLAAVSTTDR